MKHHPCLRCPVCGRALAEENDGGRLTGLRCEAGHRFDAAREGYVNLLPPSHKSGDSGDNREMLEARRVFLEAGYYAPFRDAAARLLREYAPEDPLLLDIGCGEGWYTEAFAGIGETVAFDIAKTAAKMTAKRLRAGGLPGVALTASAASVPLLDGTADAAVNFFSPLDAGEIRRVLKAGGVFLYAVPSERHLWQLKETLYERPYPNTEKDTAYEGLTFLRRERVRTVMEVRREHLMPLLTMTPYCYRTPREGIERLQTLDGLTVEAGMDLLVYRAQP